MEQKPPTAVIEAAHAQHLNTLPFHDTRDLEDADRGFLAALSPCVVTAADGRVVWDNDGYAFLTGDAPTSVHPSLWRQSQLCAKQGLYEVVEGIYQVRGLDLSNISFIEGDTGVIVIDPLVCTETASAALQLYRAHRGYRAVSAVIYTHSHVDHFGGVLGVTSQADVDAGKVAVIAPEHFTQHAVQENVYAGTAMARRAAYMYGAVLARGTQGQVGCGLGQAPSLGEVALIVPTVDVRETGEKHTVDGVEISEAFRKSCEQLTCGGHIAKVDEERAAACRDDRSAGGPGEAGHVSQVCQVRDDESMEVERLQVLPQRHLAGPPPSLYR